MKKQITFLLFIIRYFLSWSQKPIPTDLTCTDEMAQEVKGRWIQTANIGTYNTNETNNRMDQIHDLISKFYPEPTGVDVVFWPKKIYCYQRTMLLNMLNK